MGLTFDFRELTADHIVYGLVHAFGGLFHIVWKIVEEAAGEEEAKGVPIIWACVLAL
jgi:hypothetical protein